MGWLLPLIAVRIHHRTTAGDHAVEVEKGHVVAVVGDGDAPVAVRQRKTLLGLQQAVDHAGRGDGGGFRLASGAGGVDDDQHLLRLPLVSLEHRSLRGHGVQPAFLHRQTGYAAGRHSLRQGRFGHDQRQLCPMGDGGEHFRWVLQIQGQKRCPRFGGCQAGDGLEGAFGQQDAHPVARCQASLPQLLAEPVRQGVRLAVGQLSLAPQEEGVVAVGGKSFGQQVGQAGQFWLDDRFRCWGDRVHQLFHVRHHGTQNLLHHCRREDIWLVGSLQSHRLAAGEQEQLQPHLRRLGAHQAPGEQAAVIGAVHQGGADEGSGRSWVALFPGFQPIQAGDLALELLFHEGNTQGFRLVKYVASGCVHWH